jgi:D-glycero-alpha-D-manno-heptose-7-phosphate kinase
MRISFGGGGSELSPYVDNFGGAVLSASIGIYAHVTILKESESLGVSFTSQEIGTSLKNIDIESTELTSVPNEFRLSFACMKHVFLLRGLKQLDGLHIITGSEAPVGSGLGSSSVLTVAILKALGDLLEINWTQTQLAKEAHTVERVSLGLAGGLQDHYAAAFGGINFIEFTRDKEGLVNPIRLDRSILNALESSLILLYTGTSRDSSQIIEAQNASLITNPEENIKIFHELKETAVAMKKSIENGNIEQLGKQLHKSWILKKSSSSKITNQKIDETYQTALRLGAYGGKISGAGGGGFMMLLVPPNLKITIAKALKVEEAIVFPTNLVKIGAESWRST